MNIIVWDSGVTQPEDKGILLKDIIESDRVDREKSFCIDANYGKGGNEKRYTQRHSRQLVITGGAFRGRNSEPTILGKVGNQNNWKNYKDKSPTLRGLSRTNNIPKTEQRLEINETGKSNALTSVSKDSLVIFDNPPHNNKFKQTATIHYKTEKSNTLLAYAGDKTRGIGIHDDNLQWRKLTPIECERLQTVPDNYTNHVSNSQRYKMLGNGWTVDVIAHIFSFLKESIT